MVATTELGRMADRVVIDAEEGTVSATRKIRESGNSIVISIPPQVLEAAGLEPGDQADIVADMDEQTITFRRIDAREDSSEDTE